MTYAKSLIEKGIWDNYWAKKKTKSQNIYKGIASFYRQFVIKRALNHFIESEFKKNAKLLHAGSGTGQVDEDIINKFDITALDISKEALKLYKFYNGEKSKLMLASVFEIPVPNKAFDGIYNLGVHEHFTRAENEKILKEFSRVLKNNGKIVLFWPPKFSLSVNFLNTTHFILNDVLKRNIRLHPEEISLIENKKQVEELLKSAGFKMTDFYFGPKDLFTHCIIVAEKQ
jgi:ubiquinone/menaquinone biosynthesis C-methylase UbiE